LGTIRNTIGSIDSIANLDLDISRRSALIIGNVSYNIAINKRR
jgi:hypothetical protein